jgi:lipopolysaccharide transport system permease protein
VSADRERSLDLLFPPLVIVRWRTALWQFLVRAVTRRYRASVFGVLWVLMVPMATLGIYAFVFGSVLHSRWDTAGSAEVPFSLNLFAGLLVFWLMADSAGQSLVAVVQHANLVKKALFPLEILPVVVVGETLFHTAINALILLVAMPILGAGIPPTAMLLPLVLAPLAILMLGATWFLSALGVYFRDLGQIIGLVMTGALFLSPVFYDTGRLSPGLRSMIDLNPITVIVGQTRRVMLQGVAPDWEALALYLALAWMVAALGLAFFRRARRTFADVL